MSDNDTTRPAPEQLEEHIEQTRQELGETVDAPSAKLDVKGRAREQVGHARDRVVEQVDHVRDLATGDEGRPTQQTLAVGAACGAVLLGVLATLVWRRRR